LYDPNRIQLKSGQASDLPAGTAGTGRVHPRRAAGRAGTDTVGMGRRVFFLKSYLTRLIFLPVAGTRVHGYHRYRYGGTRAHRSAG
jgi:hypothetical protein